MNNNNGGSGCSTSMKKTNPRHHQQSHKNQSFNNYDNHNYDEKPGTSSNNSSYKSHNRRKSKRVYKKRATHVGKTDLESAGAQFGEEKSGQLVVESESMARSDVVEVVEECDEDDVVTRLGKLQVGFDDVELSEDLISSNDQAQEDELLAMESIYGENVHVLGKQCGLRSFQIHIHFELPGEFPVAAKLKTNHGSTSAVDNSDEFSYTFKVRYLSPIVLTCLLPRSYPSHNPPLFTITVQWLHESKISELCSMLDLLWDEQPGQEILYQWVEWLHVSSLPFLGFGEELVLGPYGVKIDSDKRAISGCVSPDMDIPSMRSYNEERQLESFLNSCHECCICFSEYAGSEFVRLPCHHFFCEKCMKTYADVHVKEGTVNKLQCPDTKCGGMIPPGSLKRLLGDEEFERWETLMLQKTLDGMSDIAYCPRCETACLEDEENHAQCSKCYFSFCTMCRERRHVGIECMTPEMKLKILEERQNSSSLKNSQRVKEREMINELLSVKTILGDSKLCPSCKMAISRTEGCNKMVCSNCNQYFCYRCGKAISGYDHFRESTCELFPQQMVNEWQDQLNDRRVVAQQLAVVFAGGARPCPACRQLNAKIGNNNHIFCWSCQNHYCYLCRKMVRRSSEHYGPRGCKQHTTD